MILIQLITGIAICTVAIAVFLAVSLFVGKVGQSIFGGTENFEYGPLMPGMVIVLSSPIWGTLLYTVLKIFVGIGILIL